jgi:hypothetical protein
MTQTDYEERRFPNPAGDGEVVFRLACDYESSTGIATGTQSFEIYSLSGELVERREFAVRFCLPEEGWFREAALGAGFSIEAVYGDYQCGDYDAQTSPYMIWLLGRR